MTDAAALAGARGERFAAALTSFYVADVLNLIGFLLITPALRRYLGPEQFGIVAVAGSLVGYLGLLNLGVKPALTRYVAAASSVGDLPRVVRLVASSIALFSCLALVAGSGGFYIASGVDRFFGLPDAHVAAAGTFVFLKSVQLAISLPLGAYEGANYGLNRIVLMNAIRSMGSLIDMATAVAVIVFELGLMTMAFSGLVTAIISSVAHYCTFRKAVPTFRLSRRNVSGGLMRELLGFGFYFALDALVVALVFKTDELVINWAMGVGAAGLYWILNNAAHALLNVMLRIPAALYPELAARVARGDREGCRRLFGRAMDGATLVAGALALPALFFGSDLARIWLQTDVPAGVVPALALVVVTHAPVAISSKYLAATGLLRRQTLMSIAEGALNLGLSTVLVWPLGLLGVALGTLLAQSLTTSWYNATIACVHMELPVAAFLLRRVGTLILAAAPAAALGLALVHLWPAVSAADLIARAAATLGVYAVPAVLLWRRGGGQ